VTGPVSGDPARRSSVPSTPLEPQAHAAGATSTGSSPRPATPTASGHPVLNSRGRRHSAPDLSAGVRRHASLPGTPPSLHASEAGVGQERRSGDEQEGDLAVSQHRSSQDDDAGSVQESGHTPQPPLPLGLAPQAAVDEVSASHPLAPAHPVEEISTVPTDTPGHVVAPLPLQDAQALLTGTLQMFDRLQEPANAAQRGRLEKLGGRVKDAVRFVMENRATSAAGRIPISMLNIALANAPSVLLNTEFRQLMAAGIKEGMVKHVPPEAQYALCMTAIAIPMLLNVVGAYADYHSGTATARSWIGRGTNLALGAAAVTLGAITHTSQEVAAQCVAIFLYCAMRDAVQACVRQPDESPGMDARAVVATGVAYVPNQLAVNRGMTVFGSPSGASAAGQIGLRQHKDWRRAGINHAGETVDDIVDKALHAWLQDKEFRVRLEISLPGRQQAIDKLLRMGSARPVVFLSSLLISNMVDKCLVGVSEEDRGQLMSNIAAAVPGADKCLVPLQYLPSKDVSLVSDTVFAVLIGLLRIPQVLQVGQSDRPPPVGDDLV
jgi:hypothetical protein